jgi:hypothetical protein
MLPPKGSVLAWAAACGFAAWASINFAHGARGGDVTSLVVLAGIAATVGVVLWRRERAKGP